MLADSIWGLGDIVFFLCINVAYNANKIDPDQTASKQFNKGSYCLPP